MKMNGEWLVLITDEEGDERVFMSHIKKHAARVITANLLVCFPEANARMVKW